MSNLLKEAIVDAQALREAALKSAESSIIEKYSNEVRNTLDKLLEQEEEPPAEEDLAADLLGGAEGGADPLAGLDPMAAAGPPLGGEGEAVQEVAVDVPLGAAEGEKLCPCPEEGAVSEVTVNLDELQEAVAALGRSLTENEEIDLDEKVLEALLAEASADEDDEDAEPKDWEITGGESEGKDDASKDPPAIESDVEAMNAAGMEEAVTLSDEEMESLVEKLVVDMGAELSGWAGRSAYDVKWQMEKEMAHRRTTEVAEDFEDLKKAQKELVFENNQLTETLSQYKQATQELKENLHDVNLSNARLLYTNRVLRNTSLNERQKDKIADAISKAGSVREAKTIYETLQSTVESTPKRGPQSLSEVINRPSSIIRATRKEKHTSDPATERMKKLAGII